MSWTWRGWNTFRAFWLFKYVIVEEGDECLVGIDGGELSFEGSDIYVLYVRLDRR